MFLLATESLGAGEILLGCGLIALGVLFGIGGAADAEKNGKSVVIGFLSGFFTFMAFPLFIVMFLGRPRQ